MPLSSSLRLTGLKNGAAAGEMRRVRDHALLGAALRALDYPEDAAVTDIRLNEGAIDYRLTLRDGLIVGERKGSGKRAAL